MSKTGEFVRYDPASYRPNFFPIWESKKRFWAQHILWLRKKCARNAAMNSMGARMPMSFTPMQAESFCFLFFSQWYHLTSDLMSSMALGAEHADLCRWARAISRSNGLDPRLSKLWEMGWDMHNVLFLSQFPGRVSPFRKGSGESSQVGTRI